MSPLKSPSLRLWHSNWKRKLEYWHLPDFFDNYVPCSCLCSAWQYRAAKCMKIFWTDPLKSIWHKSLLFLVWFIPHNISSQMSVWPWCRFLIMANESVQVLWCAEFKPVPACWFHIIFPYSLRSSWGVSSNIPWFGRTGMWNWNISTPTLACWSNKVMNIMPKQANVPNMTYFIFFRFPFPNPNHNPNLWKTVQRHDNGPAGIPQKSWQFLNV